MEYRRIGELLENMEGCHKKGKYISVCRIQEDWIVCVNVSYLNEELKEFVYIFKQNKIVFK